MTAPMSPIRKAAYIIVTGMVPLTLMSVNFISWWTIVPILFAFFTGVLAEGLLMQDMLDREDSK